MRALSVLLIVTAALAGCLDGTGLDFGSPEAREPTVTPVDPGWPPIEDAELRPGAKIPGCTTNFLFSNPSNTTLYLGTASHCLTGASIGDTVPVAGGVAEATIVYCSWGTIDGEDTCTDKTGAAGSSTDSTGFANDFALLELPESARDTVHPALLHWGGPTELIGPPGQGAHVLTYGNSSTRDAGTDAPDALDPREGYVTETGEWTTRIVLVGPSVPGDSGSPVIAADGGAIGSVQTVGADGNGVTNLAPALEYMEANTELQVELKTWDTLVEPMLPERPLPGVLEPVS